MQEGLVTHHMLPMKVKVVIVDDSASSGDENHAQRSPPMQLET